MAQGISAAVSGMHALWMRHEVLANNLANASTPGFKRDDVLLVPETPPPTQTSLTGSVPGPLYLASAIQWTDYSQGPLQPTGRPLDVALDGPGFFVVDTPAGPRYTRNGALHVSADGYLTTARGLRVQGEGGPIRLEAGRLAIGQRGEIQVDGRTLGTLKVVDFPTPYQLVKQGAGLYAPADPLATPRAAAGYEVVGGTLEGANVSPVETMVSMIEVLRTYEATQKAIQATDEINGEAVNEVGRVS
jgi:flagellar basal-body rod protein FlgG